MSLINEALKRAKEVQNRQPALASADVPLEPAAGATPGQGPVPWTVGGLAIFVLLVGAWCISVWWRSPGPTPAASSGSKPVAGATKSTASTASPAPAQPAKPKSAAALASAAPVPAVTRSSASPATSAPALAKAGLPSTSRTIPAVAQTVAATTPAKQVAASSTSTSVAKKPASVPPSPAAAVASPAHSEMNKLERVGSAEEEEAAARRAVMEPAPDPSFMTSFKLQGVFYRRVKATAMINGQVLHIGDEINGARLVSVETQSAGLLWHGRTNVLYLK